MTITNYTFFSPNGDDFPVTANADGKLYMMLTAMTYGTVRARHWKEPINTALNRIYTNTSIVLGGRYFELTDHSITLIPNTTNFIHAVIDLSNALNPVTITVENANNSNTTDINNNSGVLKQVFDIVVTNGSDVTSASLAEQAYNMPSITSNKITVPNGGTITAPVTSGTLNSTNLPNITISKSINNIAVHMVGQNASAIANNGNIGRMPTGFIPSQDWHFQARATDGKSYRLIVSSDGLMKAGEAIPASTSFRDTLNYIL